MDTKKFEKIKYKIVLGVVVLVIGLLVVIIAPFLSDYPPDDPYVDPVITPTPTETEIVACTSDAMICDDGTVVGRQGPDCEFAPCPEMPEGVTLLFKDLYLPYEEESTKGVLRFTALNEDQMQELLLQFIGPMESPACSTNIKGDACVTPDNFSELNIDWNNQIVIASSLGVRGNGGYSVSISGYEVSGDFIYVNLEEKTPGDSCMTTSVLTNPYVIAALDIAPSEAENKSIVFKVSEVAGNSCNY